MNIQPTAFAGAAKADERAGSATLATTASAKPTAVPGAIKEKSDERSEPTGAELKSAVAKLNDSLTATSQDLQFSVDEDSKRTVVKLIDRNTLEVLRQMPSKEALEIAKSLDKAMGKLIDQRA